MSENSTDLKRKDRLLAVYNVKNGGWGVGAGWSWYRHRCSIWTLPLSPQDILSRLNYFPGPRVRNLTPPPTKKKNFKCFTYAHTARPPRPHIATMYLLYAVHCTYPPSSYATLFNSSKPSHPTPTQKSTKCLGDSGKSEVKMLCLTRSQLIIGINE